MYAEGRGVEQDDVEAVAWYRKAAEQGDAAAQFNLGWMYAEGRGMERNYTIAVEWYLKAAERGHERAQAFLLGRLSQLYPDPINLYKDTVTISLRLSIV